MNRIEILREIADALHDVNDFDLRSVDRKSIRNNIMLLTTSCHIIRELRNQCQRQAKTITELENILCDLVGDYDG